MQKGNIPEVFEALESEWACIYENQTSLRWDEKYFIYPIFVKFSCYRSWNDDHHNQW